MPGRGRRGVGGKARKAPGKKKTFFKRRKVCRFTAEHIEYVDYKDVKLLQQYILERAKILPRRISGNSARHQRMVSLAIKRARHLALLPFTTD
jgi:small subunit ribosomal protein S18